MPSACEKAGSTVSGLTALAVGAEREETWLYQKGQNDKWGGGGGGGGEKFESLKGGESWDARDTELKPFVKAIKRERKDILTRSVWIDKDEPGRGGK